MVTWRKKLHKFQHFLNTQQRNITFTLEIEQNNQLPCLEILIERKLDGFLNYQVFRKPVHTNRYLHATLHHHPSQKQSILYMLIYRVFPICDQGSVQSELNEFKNTPP